MTIEAASLMAAEFPMKCLGDSEALVADTVVRSQSVRDESCEAPPADAAGGDDEAETQNLRGLSGPDFCLAKVRPS
eukprot:scaffold180846_cov31-Prasinocladus_malaysianus.AAC.3